MASTPLKFTHSETSALSDDVEISNKSNKEKTQHEILFGPGDSQCKTLKKRVGHF